MSGSTSTGSVSPSTTCLRLSAPSSSTLKITLDAILACCLPGWRSPSLLFPCYSISCVDARSQPRTYKHMVMKIARNLCARGKSSGGVRLPKLTRRWREILRVLRDLIEQHWEAGNKAHNSINYSSYGWQV